MLFFLRIVFILIGIVAGMVFGYVLRIVIARAQKRSLELELAEAKLKSSQESENILEAARGEADRILTEARNTEREREKEFVKTKDHLEKRESLLDKRQADLDKGFTELQTKIDEVRDIREKNKEVSERLERELEKIAGITREEARNEIFAHEERGLEEDLLVRLRKLETVGNERLQSRAREILATAIHRLASKTTSEFTTTSVQIPSEDIKGKIIGKEGRNIRTFERITGVELIVDDVPDAIIISCFDPVRRHIARLTLERLISDGRIQPAKIEELYERTKTDVGEEIKKEGESACAELGIYNLDPRLVAIIGRLHYRTSYGQNVLRHSIECAHLAEMIASEIGADVTIAKTGALVHDIGKALDHEFEGGHVEIGIRVLQKFGVDERVIIAMRSHHDDYPHESVEAVIVQVCDMISGGRPGARRDTVENYIKRLRELEAVANAFQGVEKSYALSAGREIRVFVTPDNVSDLQARETARNIAIRIEKELRYPGEIKITVIRENRIIDFAR